MGGRYPCTDPPRQTALCALFRGFWRMIFYLVLLVWGVLLAEFLNSD